MSCSSRRRSHQRRYRSRVSSQIRETVALDAIGSSKTSSNAASTSRVERPRKKLLITNDSSACVRVTPLPRTLLSNPSLPALRTRGRSSSSSRSSS